MNAVTRNNFFGKYSVIKNCNKKEKVDNILYILVLMTVGLITLTKNARSY